MTIQSPIFGPGRVSSAGTEHAIVIFSNDDRPYLTVRHNGTTHIGSESGGDMFALECHIGDLPAMVAEIDKIHDELVKV